MTGPVLHVVQMSGGITSWAAARRVAEQHGTDGLVLLFADTLIEHPDLYRFLDEAAADIGVPITRVADGRTPTEVFRDQRFIGNSRVAPCSKYLKQVPCRRWLEEYADPTTTALCVGIDWTTKDANRRRGIREPEMYRMGFEHNNCSGRCVRGGQGQWAHLLKVMPAVYAAAEADEASLQRTLGTDATHLRDRTGDETRPLSLAELRSRVEASDAKPEPLFDAFDWGGCGCMTDSR